MLRVQTLFSRLAVGRPMPLTRPLSYTSVVAKQGAAAVKSKPTRAATDGKKKASGEKKAAKETKKAEPKAAKKPTEKELTAKAIASKRAIVSPPPGPSTAYSLFVKDHFAKIKSNRADKPSFVDVSRDVSALWKGLSDAEKQAYEQKSQQAHKQHKDELRKWWSTVDRGMVRLENLRRYHRSKETGVKIAKLKDPSMPKQPLSAFMIYNLDNMSTTPGATVVEKSRAIGASWNALSDKQKEPYVEKARAMAEKYKKERDAYNASFGI